MAEQSVGSEEKKLREPAGMSITGVILAGGQNRRMGGRMKAQLPFAGQLFVERQLAELSQLCSEIVIVANEPGVFDLLLEKRQQQIGGREQAGVQVIGDLHPGLGPLAGMQAAMAASRSEALWVVACDMPLASAAAARAMALLLQGNARCDAVVPRLEGRLHPLHAIYRQRCLSTVSKLLDEGSYRVMELLLQLEVVEADEIFFGEQGISHKFAMNVNEPADLDKLL